MHIVFCVTVFLTFHSDYYHIYSPTFLSDCHLACSWIFATVNCALNILLYVLTEHVQECLQYICRREWPHYFQSDYAT